MSRLLLVLILLALLLIAVDPDARQKAVAFLNKWNNAVVVNETSTPTPTSTPVPTAVADNDNNKTIPNTGGDSTNEPIIQVNWDALNAALQKFWDSLRDVKINLNPQGNK